MRLVMVAAAALCCAAPLFAQSKQVACIGSVCPVSASLDDMPATSTPVSATLPVGTTIMPPFVPQLKRGVRVIIKGTWSGTVTIGTSSAANACAAAAISPLTVAGAPSAVFSSNANELIDVATLGATPGEAAPVYCAQGVITSGAASVTVRQ